jgi:transposase
MIKRRHHTLEFKQQLVAESSQTGASVAGVALAHGINANQLHKWRRKLLQPNPIPLQGSTLLPVTVAPTPMPTAVPAMENYPGAIDIELPRARLTIRGRVDPDALQTVLAVLRPR